METTPAPPATNPVQVLATALDSLGRHAALMDQREEEVHDGCSYCETMKLFSRVAGFGTQLRKAERRHAEPFGGQAAEPPYGTTSL